MDPFSMAIAGVGMATSIFGGLKSKKAEKKLNAAMNAERLAISGLQKEQASLEALRATRDNVRRSQAARSSALAAGASSGAGLGSSSIQGGLATATGQANLTSNAIEQNLDFGMAMASRQDRLTQLGGELKNAQSSAQLISGIGSIITSNAKAFSNIGQQAGAQGSIGNWTTTTTQF